MVAEPPRLAQKISASTIGTGSNLRSCESSTVTAAKNRMTVILSMNMASTALITIKVTKIGKILYFTALAMVRHSHRKNPAFAIPSTITIMPATKIMVSQLMPLELLSPALIQNLPVKIDLILSVSVMAAGLFMQMPKTMSRVAAAHPSVIQCLGILSSMISANISTKITTATIASINHMTSFPILCRARRGRFQRVQYSTIIIGAVI